ncbi:hypothetical protein MBLNU230_g3434t1 [Neophaeotheca triangularis]
MASKPLPTGGVPLPSSAQPPPTPAQSQNLLDNGIWYALRLWPALEVAVSNSWGGPNSADKRDWFAGAMSEYLTSSVANNDNKTQTSNAAAEPDLEDVEAFLLQVMLDEFEVNVEDESEVACAKDVWGVWKGLRDGASEGRLGVQKAGELERRFQSRGKLKVDVEVVDGPDQEVGEDEDWSDEDEEDDVQMGGTGVAGGVPPTVRERVEPEVDEDGFTKVQGKKKR